MISIKERLTLNFVSVSMMCNKTRALIVEDEIFVALDLERILEDRGYLVVAIAADRAEAMRHAALCDVAFVDINLRDGATGPEIANTLATEHGVSIVFVTANPSQIGASSANAVCYVRKPFCEGSISVAAALTRGEQQHDPAVVQLNRSYSCD